MHQGTAHIGDLKVTLNEHQEADNLTASAFVRPHDIEISRSNTGGKTLAATISYIHAIGSLVRVELEQVGKKELIEVELSRERFRELALKEGEQVFMTPHKARVFINNAAK